MALEKIGPYKFEGILGRGGMGSVYRGVHVDTGEVHAVKVLAPTYAHDDHFRGRFESEIQALIKLDHRNIVRLLSYGQEDAMLFFAMELVEGNSLFQMQKKGHRFDWREVLKIAKEVSMGLRHAHDRGIIHRDLKPGNLLMTIDSNGKPDYVKITDFGIAKRYGSSQNTGENVLGTMDFMSPEQAKGEPVTIRSDLYSLGTVMFTLLSGRPPFTANSVEESLRNLTRVPAPHISTVVPDVPADLDDIIKRLMAKRPENRIQTALALLYQIEEVENMLRDHSEARTAHLAPPKFVDDTFAVSMPRTTENTDVQGDPSKAEVTNSESQTIEFTDHNRPDVSLPEARADYFETVTEKTRMQPDEVSDHRSTSAGIWPIVIALLAVIGLGAYGVYQVTRPPSAEALYSEIEKNSSRPNLVVDEINEFLEYYPDDERVEQVEVMKQVGESIQLFNSLSNTLSVRRNLPGDTRLTDVEKQFMQIVDIADSEPEKASIKMAAFVTLYKGAELSPRDQKCVDAAQGYRIKIDHDARMSVLANLNKVRAAMNRAQKTTTPDEAIQIYKSVLELYGNLHWGSSAESRQGRDLVQKAREMLELMKTAKQKADQDARTQEPSNSSPDQ